MDRVRPPLYITITYFFQKSYMGLNVNLVHLRAIYTEGFLIGNPKFVLVFPKKKKKLSHEKFGRTCIKQQLKVLSHEPIIEPILNRIAIQPY